MAFPLTRQEHDAIAARIEALPELIVAAAVRVPFGILTRERPARHGDLWGLLPRGMQTNDPDVTHGFLTSRGRFVDRQEAARLVVEARQGTPRVFAGYVPALHSEDMWLDLFELQPADELATRDGADEPHLVEASTEREARSHTDPTTDPLIIVKPRRKG